MATSVDDIDFTKHRQKWEAQRDTAKAQLEEAERRIRAIDAYERALSGEDVTVPPEPEAATKRKGPAPGTPRAPRGSGASAKDKVLSLIRDNRDTGIKSKEVEDQLPDIKNVANVLSQLNREKLIQNSGRGQPWFPATALTEEQDAA